MKRALVDNRPRRGSDVGHDAAGEGALGPLRPYRDFVDWLQKYEQSKAESYWRAALKGFTVPTPLVGINSLVADGRLRVNWGYSEAVHRRSTIERVAQNFMEALRSLIRHCTSPSAGGYTPSDFVGAGLDQEELDHLISQLSKPEV
jgi:non-ribosomal peptide synthase protein (TIGR01720 family)